MAGYDFFCLRYYVNNVKQMGLKTFFPHINLSSRLIMKWYVIKFLITSSYQNLHNLLTKNLPSEVTARHRTCPLWPLLPSLALRQPKIFPSFWPVSIFPVTKYESQKTSIRQNVSEPYQRLKTAGLHTKP